MNATFMSLRLASFGSSDQAESYQEHLVHQGNRERTSPDGATGKCPYSGVT